MGPNAEASELKHSPAEDYVPLHGESKPPLPRKYTIIYKNVFILLYLYVAALYGLYLCFTTSKWATIVFNAILYIFTMLGVTAGAHRLWSHRAYKAKLPLQILLMLFHSLSYQDTVFNWCRNHRAHHKYCDTDADPVDARRGFFFAHVGSLLVKRDPEAIKKWKTIDLSDLYENPVLQFQHKYSFVSSFLSFVLPALVPVFFWQETLNDSYHVSILRVMLAMNAIMFTNSAAHRYGYKPYDARISATQYPTLSVMTLGESFHNYHHVFPFDYRSAELGNNYINLSTIFIDFFAWVGWAYDLRYASEDIIAKRADRSGDGTDLWGRAKEKKTD